MGCEDCKDFYDDTESGECGTILSHDNRCYEHPKYDNLVSFPFKKKMDCFRLN